MQRLRRLLRKLDDLLGASRSLGPILEHLVPHARKSRWFYVLGSATLTVFILQVITGTALSSAYVTGSGQAYDSLQFITHDRLGHFLRGMHDLGASAMIILIGLHTIRVYLMASYKFPRQMNWLTGVVLLVLTLAMALTGQLLRWDQNGFWTAVVAAEQAGKVPIVGHWVARAILAGDTAGGATLSRFFAAHVFFVPGLIFLFVGVHLYLVLHNGISEPPRVGQPVEPRTYRAWYHALLARDGVPFWPDAAWRDLVFALLVVIAIVVLALTFGPAPIGKPPDPTLVGASPRPDWYFLWYFALLSLIPKWLERWLIVLGPLIFGICLIALPIVAPRGERSPLRRPWSIVIVLGIIFTIGYYSSVGVVAPWSPRMDAPPLPPAVVGVTDGPIAAGARVFYDKGCEYCHLVSGYGGVRGPDLSFAGDALTPDQMRTRIFSGAENMPSYAKNLTDGELDDLIQFLQSRHRLPSAPSH